jgi:lipopolysaccharide/colanic/teichoic acid biosynthesis glycosyltransferase
MNKKDVYKYFLRFVTLQVLLTITTISYFDIFLIGEYQLGYEIIINNLFEDRGRFYEFVPKEFIKIDIFLSIFIFLFLILLYSSNFYSYVNDLSFSINKNLLDEFIPIYLIWTASLLSFLQIFRFTAVSRLYLIIFTFIVPLLLVIFRNSEAISTFLGRNPTKENYMLFNVEKDSVFRELRLLKFRNNVYEHKIESYQDYSKIIEIIKNFSKENLINILVFNIEGTSKFVKEFESYLLKVNKKILLICDPDFSFSTKSIYRSKEFGEKKLIYINNDIQYGSMYILKRISDIVITILVSPILISLLIPIYIFVLIKNGRPVFIKQNRIGLHGNVFSMFKIRTMRVGSHGDRAELEDLNKNTGPLFKIENDPRLITGGKFIRKFSIDEIPQFLNVIKGNMSVVGPRPLFPEDSKYFDQHYLRRLNVLPGITGLLQINDRNTDDFDIWYKYDLEYIENWSLIRDFEIVLKTPFSLFRSKTIGK